MDLRFGWSDMLYFPLLVDAASAIVVSASASRTLFCESGLMESSDPSNDAPVPLYLEILDCIWFGAGVN